MALALRVLSVQVGKVAPIGGEGPPLRSAIDKRPVVGPVRVGPLGIEGDEVGHPKHHGGPDQALLMCSAESLRTLAGPLGRPLPPGSFGENVTIEGCDDGDVCIGDVFRWGAVELEVTSPRRPCEILTRFLGHPDTCAIVATPHRAGWYVRVRTPGTAGVGDRLSIVSRGFPSYTVARAAAIRDDATDVAGAQALLSIPSLGASWRRALTSRVPAPPAS